MASAANESHATSSAVADDENWKYIECAKCREGAVIQDKQDPNIHALRPDFHLTACGHIACLKCLQASIGQDGSQICPRCRVPMQDWITLLDAQKNPSLGLYFRSVETMLAELTQTIRFQTSNLRNQAAFYKDIANKQSAALKVTKKELADLRTLKKNYEALQRENAALKTQLAGGYPAQTSPLLQHTGHAQHSSHLIQHESHELPDSRAPRSASRNMYNPPQQAQQAGDYAHQHPAMHDVRLSMDPEQARLPLNNGAHEATPESRAWMYQPAPQYGLKRIADEVGLGLPPVNLPPRLRESDLPANAMSSAQQHDDRSRDQLYLEGNATPADRSDFLNQFRFQGGQSGHPTGRTASRQSNGRSPREPTYVHRRSTSRSSRGDLPAIEEAPFQQNSVRGEAAHPPEAGSSRNRQACAPAADPYRNEYRGAEDSRGMQSYGGDNRGFVPASRYQPAPAPGFSEGLGDNDGRHRTFRPLVARQNTDPAHQDRNSRPGQDDYISPPVLQQRPFRPGTARPATAQAGNTLKHHSERPQYHVSRPATAQASRPSGRVTGSVIRPMAIPPTAGRPSQSSTGQSTKAFRFQPERR